MYDLFVACSDLFPILDFFIKSKLIFGLFGKELFECVAFFCLLYEMFSVPGMKENCFKTSSLTDTKLKGNKNDIISVYYQDFNLVTLKDILYSKP